MYCSKCGTLNDDNSKNCTACGNSLNLTKSEPSEATTPTAATNYGGSYNAGNEKVPNYLVWSIIVTVISVFLCNIIALPTGIVAIVFSTQVDSKLKAGDFDGAVRASKNAKIWNWVTTGLEILSVVLGVVLLVLVIVGSVQYSL